MLVTSGVRDLPILAAMTPAARVGLSEFVPDVFHEDRPACAREWALGYASEVLMFVKTLLSATATG